jgi:hypothetical protein
MTATTAGKVWREWRGWPGSETWRPCEAVLQRCSMRGPRPCWLAGGPAGPPECQVCPALAHLRIAGGRCEGRGPAAGQGRAAPDQGMHMHTQHSSKASCPLLELAAAPRGRGWAPLCLPAAAAISASSRAAATATEPSGRQAGCCHCLLPCRLAPLLPAGLTLLTSRKLSAAAAAVGGRGRVLSVGCTPLYTGGWKGQHVGMSSSAKQSNTCSAKEILPGEGFPHLA